MSDLNLNTTDVAALDRLATNKSLPGKFRKQANKVLTKATATQYGKIATGSIVSVTFLTGDIDRASGTAVVPENKEAGLVVSHLVDGKATSTAVSPDSLVKVTVIGSTADDSDNPAIVVNGNEYQVVNTVFELAGAMEGLGVEHIELVDRDGDYDGYHELDDSHYFPSIVRAGHQDIPEDDISELRSIARNLKQ